MISISPCGRSILLLFIFCAILCNSARNVCIFSIFSSIYLSAYYQFFLFITEHLKNKDKYKEEENLPVAVKLTGHQGLTPFSIISLGIVSQPAPV
jgi:hypothetical protein